MPIKSRVVPLHARDVEGVDFFFLGLTFGGDKVQTYVIRLIVRVSERNSMQINVISNLEVTECRKMAKIMLV